MSGDSSLLGRGTWFNPGPATLVVRPAGWMLLVPGVKSSLVASAWRVLGEPPAADALLGDLASGSEFETEDRLPPVLFALGDGTRRTIGLTGTSPLAVYTAEGRQLLAGTEEGPAVITELDGVHRIAFGDLPAEDPAAALRSVEGMSRVRGFVLMTIDPAELEEAARTQLAEQVEADGSSILDPAAKERAAQRKAARDKEKREREERRAQESAARAESASAPSSSRSSSSPARNAAAEAPAGLSMFDDLFAPSAAAQASPPAADAGTSEQPSSVPAPASASADPAPASSPAPAPAPAPEPAPAPAPAPVPAGATPAPVAASAGSAEPVAAHRPQTPASGRSTRLVTSSLFDRRAARSAERATETTTGPTPSPSPAPAPAPPAAPAPVPSPTPTGEGAQVPAHAEMAATDSAPVTRVEPIDPDAAEQAGAPEPGASPVPIADPPHPDPAPHPDPSAAAAAREPDAAATDAESSPGPARAAGASDLGAVIGEGGSAYDDLFGRTLHRSIEAAAVRAAGEDGDAAEGERASEATLDVESLDLDAAGAPGDTSEEATPDGAPSEPVGPEPVLSMGGDEPRESSGDFIDWVPGMRRTAPEVAQAARAAARTGAERAQAPNAPAAVPGPGTGRDGAPSDAAALPRSASSAGSPAQPTGQAPTAPAQAVTLPGAVCENRHANPPEATTCRWCGARIRGGVRTVARPPLGMIEISTGGRFLLDRSAIIGRRPRASRVSGDDVPQLITVPSPQQDISRSHVALRLEGWHVVAEDLRTTNGTTLLRSGEAPQRLRSGQSPVLADGDRLDLGDGVVLTLLGRPS